MNPRKVGTPARESIDPLELFLPESPQTGTAEGTAPLDLGELALRRSPTEATTLSTARLRPRRSILRSVSASGVVVVSLLLALIVGAAVRNRLNVAALSDSLVTDRISTPPPGQVLPPADVVRDSATIESTLGATDKRPATITPTKRVAAPLPTRPSPSLARSGAAVSRATPPAPRVIERREESRPPSPIVAATTASSTPPAVNSAPAVPVVNSAPEVVAASSAPALPSVLPAAPVSAPIAPPPPASASAASATPAAGLTTEPRGVAVALNRYQEAFSALDVNAAHAVWPNVDVKALAKAFDQLEEQTFDLEGCNITVAGTRAEADCGGNARYIRKIGSRALRVEPRRWHFTLRQTNDQWVIDAVNAR
jgi:hypothetical protein